MSFKNQTRFNEQKESNINIKIVLLFSLAVLNIIFNTLLTFFERGSILAYTRAVIIYSIIFYLIYNIQIKNTWPSLPLLFPIYYLVLVFFSSDILRSIDQYFKFLAPILLLPVAYWQINKKDQFLFFTRSVYFVLLIFILFTYISNRFNVGWNAYVRDENTDVFSVGLGSAQLYFPALAIVIIPFLSKYENKKNKILLYILGVVSFILLILSIRRTSILIVILGFLLYYYYIGNISNLLKILILISLVLVITFPLYRNALIQRMELRASRFSETYKLTQESRYRETILVINDMRRRNLIQFLFGEEFFNSQGNYGGGLFGQRMLHVDYTRLLHGSGVIGLAIYLGMYLIIWKEYLKSSRLNSKEAIEMKSVFKVFFFLSLFISLSGQMYDISFRSYLFLIMGGTLGVLASHREKHEYNS